ncbi:MAG TPA: hypothetical protein VF002_08655 [Gaiellaceae bacterium]
MIQFATADDSSNSFVCTPASSGTMSPNTCMIVQTAPLSGDNNAKCVEQSSSPTAAQDCEITQTNAGTGNNNAVVYQLIIQGSQTPSNSQKAGITQSNTTGGNAALLTQTIVQSASTSVALVSQNQNAQQTNSINQSSGTGNQVSLMAQTVSQKEFAGPSDEDGDDDSQGDEPDEPFAGAAFMGSQNQNGNGISDTTQTSTGVSQSFNFQNMLQVESAPMLSAVTQYQLGPFRCCTFQGSNANDLFTIQQSKNQFTSSPTSVQHLDQIGELDTSGHGHIGQFANQNGTTQSNTCDTTTSGACFAAQSCNHVEGGPVCSPAVSCNTPECGTCFTGCFIGSPLARAARNAPSARLNRYIRSARFTRRF